MKDYFILRDLGVGVVKLVFRGGAWGGEGV